MFSSTSGDVVCDNRGKLYLILEIANISILSNANITH